MTVPEWLYPGARVAILSSPGGHVQITTVAKLTATQVVLADASNTRFRLNKLNFNPVGERDPWRNRALRPLDDPQVRRVLASGAVTRLQRDLDKLLRVQLVGATPEQLLDKLTEAEKLVAAARERVQELAG